MRFGFKIPHNWGIENPQDVIDVATRAEELGFDSVWVSHHVLHTESILARLGDRPYYDSLTVLTYVAALTKRVRLGTSVLVLPYFNPIVLAKALATLDVLSGGRLVVGVGVGGQPHESSALGGDFRRRGAYGNESIEIMKALWTQADPSFEGDFYSFSGVKFSPKPFQKPHPPILIGGGSRAALRRVARLGDGWFPGVTSPEDLAGRLDGLKAQLEAAGRRMADITLTVSRDLDVQRGQSNGRTITKEAKYDELLREIESYEGLGVSEMSFSVSDADVSLHFRAMEELAEQVMPRARRA